MTIIKYQIGDNYKISVDVSDIEIQYEKDDEGKFRAVVNSEKLAGKNIDGELLEAIGEGLETVLR